MAGEAVVYCFFILYLIEGGSPVLLAIWERRHHFLGNFGEEAPFYWVNWGGGSEVFFMSKTVLEVGCSFVL